MALYDVSTSEKKASPALIAGATNFSEMPVGSILPYGGSTLPSGYLLCDGTEVSRTTYAELYSVIGDSFKGNKTPASGNFCLPDLRECTLKGASDTNNDTYTIGTHQKIAVGEFLDDRVQEHSHSILKGGNTGDIWAIYNYDGVVGNGNPQFYNTQMRTINARSGITTEVKSVGVNYIIKAKMVGVPADFMAKVDEAVEEVLTPVDITSQITMVNGTDGNPLFNAGSGTDWDIFSCVKYGRMVVFSVCFGTFTGKVTSGLPCFTGLPKAVIPAESGGSFDTRWFINRNDTRIQLYFSRPSSELENTATRFQLTYFTTD